MNEEVLNDLKKLLGLFPGSYINQNLEVILIPKTNTYFSLKGVGSRRDIIAKLLMWCTRTISKERPYKQELRNFQYRYDNTVRLGRYVGKIITTADKYNKRYTQKIINLCPDCKDSFLNWLKKG